MCCVSGECVAVSLSNAFVVDVDDGDATTNTTMNFSSTSCDNVIPTGLKVLRVVVEVMVMMMMKVHI